MLKYANKLSFLVLFFLISVSFSCAGYVNTYSVIYDSTTEASDVIIKGDMWISSNVISGVPTESRVEFHSTGDNAIVVNDGDVHISTGSYLKFSDGSLQNTAGVGSAGNVSNNSDSIIVADADNSSAGDILFKIYNTEAASIDNTTKNFISDYEIEVSSLNTNNVIAKIASSDIIIKNSADTEIAKFLDTRRSSFYNLGQKIDDFTVNTTTDIPYSEASESGFLILCRTWGGVSQHDFKLYFYASSALTNTITLITTSQSAERASLAFLSNGGSPNFIGTLRVTDTEATEGTREIIKIPIIGSNYGF